MAQYQALIDLADFEGLGTQINGEAAYDASGCAVSSAGDLNGDGFDDLIIGAQYASPNGASSGAAYVVFGSADGLGAILELSTLDGANGFKLNGAQASDRAGVSLAAAGDVNGDGIDDIIVGAYGADPGTHSYAGTSYVVFGHTSGFPDDMDLDNLDGNNGFRINGVAADDHSARAVSSAGDFNGDGFDDLIVGAPTADNGANSSGSSYIVFGGAAFTQDFALSALDGTNGFRIDGEAAGDIAGMAVSGAGDLNGDGFDDVVIGARYATPHGTNSGASYIVFGSDEALASTLALSALDGNNGFQISGEAESDLSGISVSAAGDFNADGIGDLIIGAAGADPNGDLSGASYIVFGSDDGLAATLELSSLNGDNGFQINGEDESDVSGFSVAAAGDFNGDGFADVIIGALATPDLGYYGATYVLFGAASGFAASVQLSNLDGDNGFKIAGAAAGDAAGFSVSGAGDLNGDGFDDIVVGARDADPNGEGSGASYVVYGGPPAEAVTRTGTGIDNTIHGGNLDDTLNGQGGNDALIGLGGNDTLNGAGGKDSLDGGGGKDKLSGGSGRDSIIGGNGADRFQYAGANDSTSKAFDTVKGADFSADRFDLAAAITAIDGDVDTGRLRKAHFDDDLSAAVGGGQLGSHHAMLFTADTGDLAGKLFLICDLNGTAGYQAGQDQVINLTSTANLGALGVEDFI